MYKQERRRSLSTYSGPEQKAKHNT